MRFPIFLFLTSLFAFNSAAARNDQVKRGPIPEWVTPSELMPVPPDASGPVFVRRQDFQNHLDEKGRTGHFSYRTKLLHSSALQLGNLSISWNPASGPPVVHAIKIYRGDETIDVLRTSSFEILRREDQLEAARLDGTLTAVLRIADLRVGDELEFSMTARDDDLTLGNNVAGVLMLAPTPPPGRFRLGLSWEQGQEPDLRMSADMKTIARRGERTVEFRFDNPGLLIPPKDAPARYHWRRVVEYSDFSSWGVISRQFASLFSKARIVAGGSPLKQEADRIAKSHASPIDRARAALKLVQQDVRYIYVGLGAGNLTPATAEETWQRRYGDCKGKTALLLGLLAELGIESEAVLVSNAGADDGLDERLPNPGLFDHVVVRSRIDGVTYWLDGTLPAVAHPAPVPFMPYRWVLPLTQSGSSIEHLEWRPATRPDEITLYEIDARAGFDQPAGIAMTTITRGIDGLKQQVQFSGVTPAQLLSVMRQQLVGNSWETIDDVRWHYDEKALASILTVEGTGPIDWDDDGDGARSLALPGGGFSPPEKRSRATGWDQDLPFYNKPEYSCYVTTVRLPETTQAKQWSFQSGYDTRIFGKNYYRAFDLRDGSVRMIRGFRVEHVEFDAASAQKDNARISIFDNSKAWIFYDPAGQNSLARDRKIVPATYDMDWTADSVPCLSNAGTG